MRQITLDSLRGTVPGTQPKNSGQQILRIDAAQILDRGRGPNAANRIQNYFRAAGFQSPLVIAVTDETAKERILLHAENSKKNAQEIWKDTDVPELDRREMVEFLGEMSTKLKRAVLGSGELPVIFE